MTNAANYRILHPLHDGLSVEAVYYGSGTLCISTQVGCAVGCPFCASGSAGLIRNLTLHELIDQVIRAGDAGHSVRRITLSGIGEPLHNPDAVRSFIIWGRQRELPVSLTTTGNPLSLLAEFLSAPHNGLMVSVHAGTPSVHRQMIPHACKYDELWSLLRQNWPRLSRRQRRKVGINYLLAAGVNDADSEIAALASRLQDLPEITLHLLALNPVAGSPFASPDLFQVAQIHAALLHKGINVRRANRWRQASEGGCGTLMPRIHPVKVTACGTLEGNKNLTSTGSFEIQERR